MSSLILSKLNQLRFNDKHMVDVKYYLREGKPPNDLTSRQKHRLIEVYGEDWELRRGKIVYKPKDLEVVPKSQQEEKLKALYRDPKNLGKGIKKFYFLVTSKYLNITRNEAEKFLKEQADYQITRPLQRSVNNKRVLSLFAVP
jgi:hypothetical protein